MYELRKFARTDGDAERSAGSTARYLGEDPLFMKLVFNNGEPSVEQVKQYSKMRLLSNKIKSTVDMHMKPVCTETNCPDWMTSFQKTEIMATCEYFKKCLYPDRSRDETDVDFKIRRKALLLEVYDTMQHVYIYEDAAHRMLIYLERVMSEPMNRQYIFRAVPELGDGIIENIVHWMQTHRKNRMIQILGCRTIVNLWGNIRPNTFDIQEVDFEKFISIAMFTRIVDILKIHQQDSVVMVSALAVFHKGIDTQIANVTNDSYLDLLPEMISELSKLIKECGDRDYVKTIHGLEYKCGQVRNNYKSIKAHACNVLHLVSRGLFLSLARDE